MATELRLMAQQLNRTLEGLPTEAFEVLSARGHAAAVREGLRPFASLSS
jgi:hypothetical protein